MTSQVGGLEQNTNTSKLGWLWPMYFRGDATRGEKKLLAYAWCPAPIFTEPRRKLYEITETNKTQLWLPKVFIMSIQKLFLSSFIGSGQSVWHLHVWIWSMPFQKTKTCSWEWKGLMSCFGGSFPSPHPHKCLHVSEPKDTGYKGLPGFSGIRGCLCRARAGAVVLFCTHREIGNIRCRLNGEQKKEGGREGRHRFIGKQKWVTGWAYGEIQKVTQCLISRLMV